MVVMKAAVVAVMSSGRGVSISRRGDSESLFFFQAEDGIRDGHVTGVQTCALPIWLSSRLRRCSRMSLGFFPQTPSILPRSRTYGRLEHDPGRAAAGGVRLSVLMPAYKIGRASCRGKRGVRGGRRGAQEWRRTRTRR